MAPFFWPMHRNVIFENVFLKRGKEGEREGEKHHCVVASRVPSTGDLILNPGMCLATPNQFNEPHQPGLKCHLSY